MVSSFTIKFNHSSYYIYVTGENTMYSTSLVKIQCTVRHWWKYNVQYVTGENTMYSTSLVKIQCTVRHWWKYNVQYVTGENTMYSTSLVKIQCTVRHWWKYNVQYVTGENTQPCLKPFGESITNKNKKTKQKSGCYSCYMLPKRNSLRLNLNCSFK